ncbi:MAG: GNAT family N-acetyltransferase [Bacilli bacterium]|nr:GNAT family N-acetyltransferase [Bacilli bacterium]
MITYLNYTEEHQHAMYEIFCGLTKEETFFKELSFDEFKNLLFNSSAFQKEGTFVAFDEGKMVGFVSANVRDENPNTSGYVHTIIVDKSYRRQGIGGKLIELAEEYIKGKGKASVRFVFLSGINWPWYIPYTEKHMHPGMPAVRMNSDFYIFLYHHGYVVNSIHEGFHLPLSEYELPDAVVKKMEQNKERGLFVELYDPAKHYGVEEFCQKIEKSNAGFANAIRYNINREKPYPFLCANESGRMVGWTGAIWNEPSGRGHFDGIIVDEDIRGAGLGKALFCYLCYQSKLNGAQYMTFFTGLDNPARYIYLGAGFKIAQSFADMKKVF